MQLNLSFNHIGDVGAAELVKAVAANSTLTEVCCATHTVAFTLRAAGARVQLVLFQIAMSASAQEMLEPLWRPGMAIRWWG